MTDLKDVIFDQPTRPARLYYSNEDGTKTKVWATNGKKSVQVMDDLNCAIEAEDYSRKISHYKTQLKVWRDNNAKWFALVLQHYPEELQAELKSH